MPTFLRDEDYGIYLEFMKTWCKRHRVAIWAYCLMPNHVHLIAVPETTNGLARAIGEATGATPCTSTNAKAGVATFGKVASARL